MRSIFEEICKKAGHTHKVCWEEKLVRGICRGLWVNKSYSTVLPNPVVARDIVRLRENRRVRGLRVIEL